MMGDTGITHRREDVMAEHVCPVWAGYFLANRLRRFLQNPYTILAPYVRPGMTVLDVGSADETGCPASLIMSQRPPAAAGNRWHF